MVFRYLLAMTAWAAAGFAAVWFARNTAMGPTVAILSPTHGVHEGDALVLVGATVCASVISLAALRRPTR